MNVSQAKSACDLRGGAVYGWATEAHGDSEQEYKPEIHV